jgi:hypothetical protein
MKAGKNMGAVALSIETGGYRPILLRPRFVATYSAATWRGGDMMKR